jgi:hypothetical protein
LFALVLHYQQPRIKHYLKKLQKAFTISRDSEHPAHSNRAKLSADSLRELPTVKNLSWIDDKGNDFKIPASSSTTKVNAESETAMTGGSWEIIHAEVSVMFDKVNELCQLNQIGDAAVRFTDSQASLLKELMSTALTVWKSVRHRSAIKTRLQTHFRNVKQGLKRQNTVITALKFLSRVYLSVVTFIDAAEKTPMFRSIECVPIKVPPQQFYYDPSPGTPMEVLKRLRIRVTGDGWVRYLQQRTTKVNFLRLRKQKPHMHCELQILHEYDAFYRSRDDASYVHPYIGCSKRCCLLCYCFILAHGEFKVRGTHETVTHRWQLPTIFPSADAQAKFRTATEHLYRTVVGILQSLFQKCYPLIPLELLAQSSAALSTARTVSDQESGQMENSPLNIR